jgi:NADH:ubiquinone oxidoreductase subunit F (NADH-binding)
MSTAATAGDLPRLLRGLSFGAPADLDGHLEAYGPLPAPRELGARALIKLVEHSGLCGRGGAAFPTATKMRAVRAARGRPIVVANGCESEPISAKDALLLHELPHLVLDGAALAARAVGADEVIIAFEESNSTARRSLEDALAQRRAARFDPLRVELFVADERFLSGQETALVSQINGGPAKPTFTPPRPTDRGVRRRPTLIHNVETLAHLALIARHGAEWFRGLGTEDEPGSRLVTVAGAVSAPGVYEIECATSLRTLLSAAGGTSAELGGLLIGGYFGSWLPAAAIGQLDLSRTSLARHGAALGCGVLVALPASSCPVAETVRIAIYLATETAGQCGPCVHGTAAIARTLHGIAEGKAPRTAFADLGRWTAELPGRGACHHPSGLVRFVSTALSTFAEQFDDHARHGPCRGCDGDPVLPFPASALALA